MAASTAAGDSGSLPDASEVGVKKADEKDEPEIFKRVKAVDVEGVWRLLVETNQIPNVFDDDGMTPLQHAAYRGNFELCQLLIDHGADVNACKHDHKYTTLHFAALSGKPDVVRLLLSHGADPDATNTVGKTPSQIGAFVGNHGIVSLINNYVPPTKLDPAFKSNRVPTETRAVLSVPLHNLVTTIHVHPVKLLMTLEREPILLDHAETVSKALLSLRDLEMRGEDGEPNEVLAFKFHYLGSFVRDADKAVGKENRAKLVTKLQKKFLDGVEPDGAQEYMEKYLRGVIKEFPFPQSALFQNMVSTLAKTPVGGEPTAFTVINSAVNGQRMFQDDGVCAACGAEKASKKCSKCRSVSYCRQECQKLDWFSHKKFCERYNMERLATEKDKKFTLE